MGRRIRKRSESPVRAPKKKRRARKKRVIPVYEEKFAVEAIYAAKMVEQKKWEYCVKWHGWPLKTNEYEPEEHLDGHECERLVASFWAMSVCDRPTMETGEIKDMMKPKVGVLIKANPEWYDYEIEYYSRVVKSSSEDERDSDANASSGEEEIDD